MLNKKSYLFNPDCRSDYNSALPFKHLVIDDFFESDWAKSLELAFPKYDSSKWFSYQNKIENKKTLNYWPDFSPNQYQTLAELCSESFTNFLTQRLGLNTKLYPDLGLNGGGLHIHQTDGKLNVHLDYSVHPKLKLQRKLNLLVYLTDNWNLSWGGGLELWEGSNKKPETLIKTVDFKFNRAVIFDTTQNSWHGLPNPLTCPEGVYRKSIAVYYLTEIESETDQRPRALFSPTKEQESDHELLSFIQRRSTTMDLGTDIGQSLANGAKPLNSITELSR